MCARQGLHDAADHYIANADYKPTAKWITLMEASRFLGPDKQLREDIDEYLQMASQELEEALPHRLETKRKSYQKMLDLQKRCHNFKRLSDWITRLSSTGMPFGVHILYGHGHTQAVNWDVVLRHPANYYKLYRRFADYAMPGGSTIGSVLPEKLLFKEESVAPGELPTDAHFTDETREVIATFSSFLSAYGCWTVQAKGWYIGRLASKNMLVNSPFADEGCQLDNNTGDHWISGVDGRQFDCSTM